MTTVTAPSSTEPRAASEPRVRRRRTKRPGWWVVAALLAAFAFLWVFPFIWMVSASLKTSGEIFQGGLGLIPEAIQWENYSRAWTDGQFDDYLRNTVIVTVATTMIVVVRCALAGYVIGRYKFPGSRLIIGIFVATLFVPTGYTIIPIVKVSMALGLLNSLTGMILALQGGGRVARRFRVLGLEARQGLHLQLTDPLTLTRGLTQREAELYPEWIDNDRR